MTASPEQQALLALLAGEQAAIFGYGVLGGRLDEGTRAAALLAEDAHRARRDNLAAALTTRGVTPPAPPPSYDVVVDGRAQALALAVRLEVGLAQRWRDLVTSTDDPALRRLGVAGLTESAVRATEWRRRQGSARPTVALPGS